MKERNENLSKKLKEIENEQHQQFLRKLEEDVEINCDSDGRFFWIDKNKKEILRWRSIQNDKIDTLVFPILHIPKLEFPEKKVGFFQSLFSAKIDYKEFFRGIYFRFYIERILTKN